MNPMTYAIIKFSNASTTRRIIRDTICFDTNGVEKAAGPTGANKMGPAHFLANAGQNKHKHAQVAKQIGLCHICRQFSELYESLNLL